MKILFIKAVVLTLITFSFCVCGCNDTDHSGNPVGGQSNKVPDFLIGTWQSRDDKWRITFGPDGSLYSIKYYFNIEPIIVSEGGGADLLPDKSIRSVYILGDHKTYFDAGTRTLTVEIAIDYFQIKRPLGDYEGNMADKFSGKVSLDNKRWDVVWDNRTTINGFEGDSITSQKLLFTHIEEKSAD